MNLQPVQIENIPLGRALPWRLYNHQGYIVFARGDIINSRQQLESLMSKGLFQDTDAAPQTREEGDLAEFNEVAPFGIFPPAGIKPQIGELVQIRLPNRMPQNYYYVHLIGYINKRSLLISRPVVTGIPFLAHEGEPIEVRMVTGNNIYAFMTTIQRLCIIPTQYMHLDFPDEVRTQKLRKSPWAKVNLNVTVTNAKGDLEAARLVNLSPDGAQLHGSPTLGKPGQPVNLTWQANMDELTSTLNLVATILHVQPPEPSRLTESHLLEYGIRFQKTKPDVAIWLNALVYRHIAEGDIA